MTKEYTLPEAIQMAYEGKVMVWDDESFGKRRISCSGPWVYITEDSENDEINVISSDPFEGWTVERQQYKGKDIAFVAQHPDRKWRRPGFSPEAVLYSDRGMWRNHTGVAFAFNIEHLAATDWETCDE